MRKAILNESYLGFDFVDDLVSALLDHSLQGTVVLKRNPPRIHYANPLACRILGVQAEKGKEIPDRPFLKFIHVQDRDEFLDTIAVCLEEKTASPLKELRLKGRDQLLI